MNELFVRWAKVLGVSLSFALLPMVFSEIVLYQYALTTGQAEVDAMAQDYLAIAETSITEAIRNLTNLRNKGEVSCETDNLQAFTDVAMVSSGIQEIGLVDTSGLLMCGAPASSKMKPLRLPTVTLADPVVTIGVVGDEDKSFGRVVVALRIDNSRRLVARLKPDLLNLRLGPTWLSNNYQSLVLLSDGSEWPSDSQTWDPGKARRVVMSSADSRDYPLHVRVSASGDVMFAAVASLRFVMLAAALVLGTVSFAVTFWILWANRYADDEFRRAVNNREFVPYYQPVIELGTGALRGCEMLVRWIRPDGTIIPPGAFLPYAEATGLIRDITRGLMLQTVEDLADLYRRLPELKVSVNLTASHFIDAEIIEDVQMIYYGSGIGFEQLMFEVTEQNPLKDIIFSRRIIRRLQDLGAKVALDDVGTGHGSLTYIQKLGVDILKIDKMFVDGVGNDSQSERIIDSLISLATTLGMGIIAEGVEEEAQVEYLKKAGVTVAQGYYFAKPLTARDFRAMVERMCAEPLAAYDARMASGMATDDGKKQKAA